MACIAPFVNFGLKQLRLGRDREGLLTGIFMLTEMKSDQVMTYPIPICVGIYQNREVYICIVLQHGIYGFLNIIERRLDNSWSVEIHKN